MPLPKPTISPTAFVFFENRYVMRGLQFSPNAQKPTNTLRKQNYRLWSFHGRADGSASDAVFKKTKVIGIVGFGSGGPDGWRLEWSNKTSAEKYGEKPIDHVSRRSPDSFKNQVTSIPKI